jgi:serine/threonine protein kinase/beta-lactam-binding protein with PASTA domain
VASSRTADQVGRVLGDRYRLLRPLGVGASAHVYVAEDVTLRRRVAVKVLHPALAEDGAFLRRFRAEARVVAALRHPHILRVYDWGDDNGCPYLVTELLEGGSLRALLDAGHLLSPAQAARVGGDVARALAYAHHRGLIHRDVKPANLLFDDEGRVSVADFGLARALAEASWTEPAGAVVGTARYAAPEQVRGEVLDDRADVYSLVLVLVEATTGEVPFMADTTIATLMGRLGRPVPVPPTLGPLAPVLAAAGHAAAGDRPGASYLAAEVDRVAGELPPSSAIPLVGSGAASSAVIDLDRDPTLVVGLAAGDTAALADDPAPPPGPPPPAAGVPLPQTARPVTPDGPPAPGATPARPPGATPAAAGVTPRAAGATPRAAGATPGAAGRRRWLALPIALLVVAAGVTAAVVATRPPPMRPVPRLVGESSSQAAAAVGIRHLRLAVAGHRYDQGAAPGVVVAQQPAAGRLRQGRAVSVIISLGPPPVPVPNLTGDTQAQAAAALADAHLKPGAIAARSSTTVAQGKIIAWTDQGQVVPQATKVGLVVSSGLPFVTVPSLSGTASASFGGARSALAGATLNATEAEAFNSTVPAGEVVGTDPGPGTSVRMDSTVTVVLSKGPPVVAIPDVSGQSVSSATQALTSVGLTVSGVSGNPTVAVTATSPAKGAVVQKGSSVELITG